VAWFYEPSLTAKPPTLHLRGLGKNSLGPRGDGTARKPLKAVQEFHTYITNNAGVIPNYGEWYRHGERISTGLIESTVNQVIRRRCCKKQQIPWTKRGAPLLVQTRVKTLHQALGAVFQRWYPDLQREEEPLAACPPTS
jgi:hypothetical protein